MRLGWRTYCSEKLNIDYYNKINNTERNSCSIYVVRVCLCTEASNIYCVVLCFVFLRPAASFSGFSIFYSPFDISQLWWWYALIAQVVLNPTTIRSRPPRPLVAVRIERNYFYFCFSLFVLFCIILFCFALIWNILLCFVLVYFVSYCFVFCFVFVCLFVCWLDFCKGLLYIYNLLFL